MAQTGISQAGNLVKMGLMGIAEIAHVPVRPLEWEIGRRGLRGASAWRGVGAMKLVKTIALEFREGKSDKVYEVDLCEVGPDRFVVNFRYGRRGAKLQGGSKTAVPVARDEGRANL